jgi:hypothetical protein
VIVTAAPPPRRRSLIEFFESRDFAGLACEQTEKLVYASRRLRRPQRSARVRKQFHLNFAARLDTEVPENVFAKRNLTSRRNG